MKFGLKSIAVSAAIVLSWGAATVATAKAEAVKIGMITTLSGGGSALGIDIRDGFQLAVDQEGGKLGGAEIELIIEDDAREPDRATEIASRMVDRDQVDIMTGLVWSNLAIAIVPKVVRDDIIYISPNAGPSLLAGAGCNANYFNVAWQNDNLHEAIGQYLQDRGVGSAFILAPNYPAGQDALTGFKRYYKGDIKGELYTKLGQTDYAAEIAQVRDASPDAVFFFLPGGMGISFIKQYNQAGLDKSVPLYGPAFSFDQAILGAVGDAALGVINSSQWNKDLNNEANNRFVADFQKAYGRLPSLYASQGYDAARLIASALSATGGNVSDKDALRAAIKAANFDSVRGEFRFGNNNHPIQDIYVRRVIKEGDVLTNEIIGKAFHDHQDAYAADCKL
ncbi:ABC transporter substrate-binding protein [Limibacillus halophilus]|uniref:Branched-chain amino acid transport system substrate-binding protein n=1 Tax=Limibacillus halophilus TaxID=1579333 RepID=A0A839SWC7_9PROT|nr:ABC transporter substrate-binding protein [Limibacillus halophilus]MBB3065816.1 branched-chain amino acid transport system substrate-binding protein [Limibacillus halophilus]